MFVADLCVLETIRYRFESTGASAECGCVFFWLQSPYPPKSANKSGLVRKTTSLCSAVCGIRRSEEGELMRRKTVDAQGIVYLGNRWRPDAGKVLADIDRHVTQQAPHLGPVLRWLVVGPEVARTLFPEQIHKPTVYEVADLVRLFEGDKLRDWVWRLVEAQDEYRASVEAEFQLDVLLTTEQPWSHPLQVLGRVSYSHLLAACLHRMEKAQDDGDHLLLHGIEVKVGRAVEIEQNARRRVEDRRRRVHGSRKAGVSGEARP